MAKKKPRKRCPKCGCPHDAPNRYHLEMLVLCGNEFHKYQENRETGSKRA